MAGVVMEDETLGPYRPSLGPRLRNENAPSSIRQMFTDLMDEDRDQQREENPLYADRNNSILEFWPRTVLPLALRSQPVQPTTSGSRDTNESPESDSFPDLYSDPPDIIALLRKVINYLVINCYLNTAKTLADGCNMPELYSEAIAKECQESEIRKQICRIIIAEKGDGLGAIEALETTAPNVLKDDSTILFKLRTLEYVKLLQEHQTEDAIEFIRRYFSLSENSELKETIQDFTSLLAYENPELSPLGYYLSSSYREELASLVNKAMLEKRDVEGISFVEKAIRQIKTIRKCLRDMGCESEDLRHLQDSLL